MSLALFDFDGTITYRETISEFLRYALGRDFYPRVLTQWPSVLGYFLGLVDNQTVKERILTATLSGKSLKDLAELGERFAKERLPALVRPKALERIKWHQSRGDDVVIVSASLLIYLLPWAKEVGINEVIGVELEERDGIITGKISGKNCYGAEKVRRIREVFDLSCYDEIYAYGDSRGDKEMLALATHPFFRPFRK